MRAWTLLCLLSVVVGQDLQVSVQQGDMRGIVMTSRSGRNFHAFLGIPYAQPPVGELRFKPPEPPGPWQGVLNATADGSMCLQKNYLDLNPQVQGDEDCLFLNVYTPNVRPDYLMEVMVYIHGGGFFSGTGASYLMGPQYFMDHDVVLVTMNYRLGVLGFLSTGDGASPGNYGFKDQVAALRWVQNNIAYFGGNPDSVTIFGQSAGGATVHLHMLSPLSEGLFHRAISESGTALAIWAWPVDSLFVAKRQAAFSGCDPEGSTIDMVECLRATDGKKLLDDGDKFKFWSVDPLDIFGPAIEEGEGAFLTGNPFYLLKTGQFHRVPWMTGVVTDEGLVRMAPILTNNELREDLNRRMAVLAPKLFELNKSVTGADEHADYVWDRVRDFYINGSNEITPENERGFINLYTDRSFVHSFHKSVIMHQRAAHANLFVYHLAYRGLYSFSSVFANTSRDMGVCHCDDLIYLFSLPLIFPPWPENHPDIEMSKKLVELWTNFAKYGHPTANDCKLWEPVKPSEHVDYVEISGGPSLTMKQDLFKERMQLWDSLPLRENDFKGNMPQYLTDLVYNYIVYFLK